jgi:hypothetical protein
MAQDNFGLDVSTFLDGDLDPYFRPLSGARTVAEAVARRWLTPTGALFYDPAFGVDVRELLGAALTAEHVFALRIRLAQQAEEDDRVGGADVDIEHHTATRRLTIRAVLRTAGGPFALVLSIHQLGAELLDPTG